MGLLGWYRKFIPDFSKLVAPITDAYKGVYDKREFENRFVGMC